MPFCHFLLNSTPVKTHLCKNSYTLKKTGSIITALASLRSNYGTLWHIYLWWGLLNQLYPFVDLFSFGPLSKDWLPHQYLIIVIAALLQWHLQDMSVSTDLMENSVKYKLSVTGKSTGGALVTVAPSLSGWYLMTLHLISEDKWGWILEMKEMISSLLLNPLINLSYYT